MRADRGFLRPAAKRQGTSTVATGLLVTVTLLAGAGFSAEPPDPTLPEILQQLRQWRASFATIRVVWHEWNRGHTLLAHPDVDPDFEPEGSYYVRMEFAWADWGAFRVGTILYEAGRPTYRSLEGTDGVRPWSVISKLGEDRDVEQWDRLQFWRPERDRPLAWNIVFTMPYGLWNGSGYWIDEYLARSENVALEGYQELDGHRCAVVRTVTDLKKRYPSIASETFIHEQTYWLDVEHGFLPRKCRMLGSFVGKEGLDPAFTWTVAEFQKLDNRLWFPRCGNFVVGTMEPPDTEWRVKEVTLNESLPRSFFQAIKPSAGTTVIDYVNMTGYRAGGASDPQRAGSGAAPSGALPRAPTVRAVPWSFPWRWAALVAALVVAAGVLLRWRQRRRQTLGKM